MIIQILESLKGRNEIIFFSKIYYWNFIEIYINLQMALNIAVNELEK